MPVSIDQSESVNSRGVATKRPWRARLTRLTGLLRRADDATVDVFVTVRQERYVIVEVRARGGAIGLARWGIAWAESASGSQRLDARSLASRLLVERRYPMIDELPDLTEPIPFILLEGSSISQSVTLDDLALQLCGRARRDACDIHIVGVCVTSRGRARASAPVRIAAVLLDDVCETSQSGMPS